ncbi:MULTISPECIES: DUF397 domain-containing protein [unclassified Streptomyces]|uniref:DUF397 domain-containing protein n=1 Tax=unclassified Streptomyces TaxID=2593676 RepID=UPI001BE9FB22|nr:MULTISPECIES: DUF397 domain-containing protein [unclassified Streptomyces]MBT2402016.1 DUF397 domain-containing protein [Streptomyces sp. ISL-21]MBT2454263.1 DUF397 domain-containing protein [Streptomyces sp. ISL-86]MBT2609474.1 DUF397 domain-containing protein [Streptomyces sp. ISL-87]
MSNTNVDRPYGEWFKSSYSGGTSGECVEACRQPGAVHVRDSKRKGEPGAPVLGFTAAAWSVFSAYAGGSR